jgi:hypothetical protein
MAQALAENDTERVKATAAVINVEDVITPTAQGSEMKSSDALDFARPPAISAPKYDLVPDVETELLHTLDTACVPQRSAGFAFKTKLDKKLYGDSYMRGFGDQLKVSFDAVWNQSPVSVPRFRVSRLA